MLIFVKERAYKFKCKRYYESFSLFCYGLYSFPFSYARVPLVNGRGKGLFPDTSFFCLNPPFLFTFFIAKIRYMEKKPDLYRLKRTLSVLEKKNKKYVTLDMLSKWVGVYPDVLADDLIMFEPFILMDSSINMNDLIPAIKEYLEKLETVKEKKPAEPKPKREVAKKEELAEYASIGDFIYKRMAGPGGLISPSASLSDHDLYVLSKLVKEEQARRKPKKKAKKVTKKKTKK